MFESGLPIDVILSHLHRGPAACTEERLLRTAKNRGWRYGRYRRVKPRRRKRRKSTPPKPPIGKVPLTALNGHECHWPVTRTKGSKRSEPMHLFCGDTAAPGRVYCAKHCRAGYQGRRAENALTRPDAALRQARRRSAITSTWAQA